MNLLSRIISLEKFFSQIGRMEIVRYNTQNGYGSEGSSKIPKYSTLEIDKGGKSLSHDNNSTTGLAVTLLRDGVYIVTMSHNLTTASYWGISVNGVRTTNLTSQSSTIVKTTFYQDGTDRLGSASAVIFGAAGDVVRPHTNGTGDGSTGAYGNFAVARLPFAWRI